MMIKNSSFAIITIFTVMHLKIFAEFNGLHSYRADNVFPMVAQVYSSGSGSAPLIVPVPVYQGGTGLTTLTDNAVLIGNDATQAAMTNAGTTGTVLIGNTGVNPAFSATPAVTMITIVDSPTIGTDGTNKAYVDLYASGLIVQSACVCATTTILPNAPTYNNGSSGVGATLTATVNGALIVDGVSVSTSDRVLIKDQASSPQNGIYTVTDPGSGGSVYALTRATDFDTSAEIKPGALVPVQSGTTNANTIWIETVTVTTIGSDPILFSQFLQAGIVTLTGDTGSATGITVNVVGGDNISTSGTGSMLTVNVAKNTQYSVLVGNSSGSLTSLAVASVNGQVLLGASGADPSFVTPTAGPGLTLTSNVSTLQYALTVPISAGNGGTGDTSLTQYAVLVGNGTSAITEVSPSATSGIPIVSQGSSANPKFTTAEVAGGGTGVTSFANVYGVIVGGTTSTNPLQVTATPPALTTATAQGLVSAGASAVATWQNVLPGYIDAATNFAYVGSTTTPAKSPNRTIIVSLAPSAGILSTATDNAAMGYLALNALTSGTGNVIVGASAGRLITTATNSVGIGYQALFNSVSGTANTALGYRAIEGGNSSFNTGAGFEPLLSTNTGVNNTAMGYQALVAASTGSNNTAMGGQAARIISTTSGATAIGNSALFSANAANNTMLGNSAGGSVTGAQNTFIGYQAANAATSGTNNIVIGYQSALPATTDSNTIIIGNATTATARIRGIFGVTTGGAAIPVLIDSNGQLGTISSSLRFKKNIIPVDDQTAQKLSMLDIVMFSYIDDATNKIHYGALAEDVEKIFPELVVYDENGDLLTIQYHQFIPLLVKYVQQQEETLQQASQKIQTMKATVAALIQKIQG